MLKNISLVLFILLASLGLGILYFSYYSTNAKTEEEASVVLQKIEEVEKLILVEGNFSEIYTYTQREKLFFDLWPVDKKVVVLINAEANVGYDLTKVEFEVDLDSRSVIIHRLPKPLILVEPDIQYYDIQQSQFYPITGKDFTTINQRAIQIIKQQVWQGQLPQIAEERLPLVLGKILFEESTQNWKVITQ